MTDIGVGLVGYGLGGSVFHAPFIQTTAGLDLRAVVSGDPAKVHGRFPDMAVVPTVEALLARPDIDLVVVASPDALHAEHAIAALAAGKHVLVDKPFATSLDAARQVSAAADRAGKRLTVFHNRRWDADFLTLRRLLGGGKLGRVVQVESHFDRWRPIAANSWKEARADGVWTDLGPHLIDQAISLFGMPEAITLDVATMREGAPAADWFHGMLHYPGLRFILHASKLSADFRLRFAVHGTEGSWIKHGADRQEMALLAGANPAGEDFGQDPEAGWYTPAADPAQREAVPNERGDYCQFWRALALSLQHNGPNPVPASEALAVMEVLMAGSQSAATGRTVLL